MKIELAVEIEPVVLIEPFFNVTAVKIELAVLIEPAVEIELLPVIRQAKFPQQ